MRLRCPVLLALLITCTCAFDVEYDSQAMELYIGDSAYDIAGASQVIFKVFEGAYQYQFGVGRTFRSFSNCKKSGGCQIDEREASVGLGLTTTMDFAALPDDTTGAGGFALRYGGDELDGVQRESVYYLACSAAETATVTRCYAQEAAAAGLAECTAVDACACVVDATLERYFFAVNSYLFCPVSEGSVETPPMRVSWTWGYYFLTIFVIAASLYIICGSAINICAKHRNGRNIVPHLRFWRFFFANICALLTCFRRARVPPAVEGAGEIV